MSDHAFEYGIISHRAKADAERSFAAAYQAQVPWTALQTPLQSGLLPAEHQFIRWSGDGLALSAVKMNDASDASLLRWFNMTDQPSKLHIERVYGSHGPLVKSNVLEEQGEEIPASHVVAVRPAEIVTIGGRGRRGGDPAL